MTWTVRREPKRATNGPARGSEMTEPAAMASSTRPSSAEERPRRSRTWGISEAQLAKAKPVAMKAAYVARTPTAVAAPWVETGEPEGTGDAGTAALCPAVLSGTALFRQGAAGRLLGRC